MSTATTTAQPEKVRILPPADFPVRWDDPADEELHWLQDRMHAPEPLAPMEQSIWTIAYQGFNRASDAYALPMHVQVRYQHAYIYMAAAPATDPAAAEARAQQSEARMDAAMASLGARWDGEWLPEIQSHLAWWDAVDLGTASTPALLAHLEETRRRLLRMWELHFRIVLPTYVAMSQFDDLHHDLFADRGAFASYRLLQGFENKTLEAGRALWALSRAAAGAPEVAAALRDPDPVEAIATLGRSAAGRDFQAALTAYLRVYG
ncbi:MAG: hypothetical protein EHM24_28730, partial [Acidobacteria bacterium]